MHDEIWEQLPPDRPFDEQLAVTALHALEPLHDQHTLDLGCGDGRLSAGLARAGAKVFGVDVSEVALERARARHPEIEFRQPAPDGALLFEDSTFQRAACVDVLQHVADTQSLMSELRRVLAPAARAVFAVPARGWLQTVMAGPRAFSRAHDPLEPVLRFYAKRSLGDLLAEFGFDAIGITRTRGHWLAVATRG